MEFHKENDVFHGNFMAYFTMSWSLHGKCHFSLLNPMGYKIGTAGSPYEICERIDIQTYRRAMAIFRTPYRRRCSGCVAQW